MTITIINGSPRRNGATGKILRAIEARLLTHPGVEVNYINLSEYQVKGCVGCERCYKTGGCHIDDRAEEINLMVARSQGVIVGSPTYLSNVSGLLKKWLDRGHIVVEQSLHGKYTMPVVTYEISGGASVVGILNSMFRYAGGNPVGRFLLKLRHNTDPFDIAGVQKRLERRTDKFHRAVARGQRRGVVSRLINFVALHLVMKPAVMRSPDQFAAVVKRWHDQLGIDARSL